MVSYRGVQLAASQTSRIDEPLRILVADDFGPFREALCRLLLSYEALTIVGEAADGDEAIELAFRLTPDVIIMYVKMPRKSGIVATEQIKRNLPQVHVIGVSTQNESFLKASMKAAGFSTFVTKDCAHTLPAVIATITNRHMAQNYPLEGTA